MSSIGSSELFILALIAMTALIVVWPAARI
jgi:hypothetical protein